MLARRRAVQSDAVLLVGKAGDWGWFGSRQFGKDTCGLLPTVTWLTETRLDHNVPRRLI